MSVIDYPDIKGAGQDSVGSVFVLRILHLPHLFPPPASRILTWAQRAEPAGP